MSIRLIGIPGGATGAEADVTVSRSGSVTQTARASVLLAPGSSARSAGQPGAGSPGVQLQMRNQNFGLMYELVVDSSSRAVKTGGELQAVVRTFAPPADAVPHGSRVVAEIAGTGVARLSAGPTGGGWTTWTLAHPISDDVEGAKTVVFCAVDASSTSDSCAGTSALAKVVSRTVGRDFFIDNTRPEIDLGSVSPGDGGNSAHEQVSVSAVIYDQAGSGIDPGSLSITLRDGLGAAVASFAGSQISYDADAERATSPLVSLVPGQTYRVELSGRDYAGNLVRYAMQAISEGGGFLVSPVSYGSAAASIPATVCSVSAEQTSIGFKTATCENVPLEFGRAQVSSDQLKRAGSGRVGMSASLASARISSTVAGVPVDLSAHDEADSRWAPRQGLLAFSMGASAVPQAVLTDPATLDLGTLTARVPATWTTATLSMAPIAAQPVPLTCAAATGSCQPDPVPIRPATEYLRTGSVQGQISPIPDGGSGTFAWASELRVTRADGSEELLPGGATFSSNDDGVDTSQCFPQRSDGTAAQPTTQALGRLTLSNKKIPGADPDEVRHSGDEAFGQWYNFITGWKDAVFYNDKFHYRWEMCEYGGSNANPGYRLLTTSSGVTVDGNHNRKVVTPTWETGEDVKKVGAKINFEVNAGPVKIGVSDIVSGGGGKNYGAVGAKGASNIPSGNVGAQPLNAVWAWWNETCSKNWLCWGTPGADGYRAAAKQVVYDYSDNEDATLSFVWDVAHRTRCVNDLSWACLSDLQPTIP